MLGASGFVTLHQVGIIEAKWRLIRRTNLTVHAFDKWISIQ